MIEALEQRGVHVHPSPLDGPADQAAIEFVESTHVWLQGLIYYGDVDRDWFEAVFLRVQKTIRQRRLLSAIFVAPPPTERKTHDLRNIGVPVVEGAEATVRLLLGGAP